MCILHKHEFVFESEQDLQVLQDVIGNDFKVEFSFNTKGTITLFVLRQIFGTFPMCFIWLQNLHKGKLPNIWHQYK